PGPTGTRGTASSTMICAALFPAIRIILGSPASTSRSAARNSRSHSMRMTPTSATGSPTLPGRLRGQLLTLRPAAVVGGPGDELAVAHPLVQLGHRHAQAVGEVEGELQVGVSLEIASPPPWWRSSPSRTGA